MRFCIRTAETEACQEPFSDKKLGEVSGWSVNAETFHEICTTLLLRKMVGRFTQRATLRLPLDKNMSGTAHHPLPHVTQDSTWNRVI